MRAQKRKKKEPEKTIVLNMDDCPDLLERLIEWARAKRRTPDQQILFHLENLEYLKSVVVSGKE